MTIRWVALAALTVVSSAVFADLDKVSVDFVQGNRGCPHTYRITMEFVGGRDGYTVVSRGTIDPPETAGFPANRTSHVIVNLSPRLNPRLVKNVRLRIEGDRPGQDITTPWELNGLRIENLENRRVMWNATSLGWTFDARNTTKTSANWATYDVDGRATKTKKWSIRVVTGEDDLRDDSSAGLLLVFRNGTTARVDIGYAKGLRANSTSLINVNLGNTEQCVNDLIQAYLVKSMDSLFFGFRSKFRALGSRDLNADTWDVRELTAFAELGDRDSVQTNFRGLQGSITEGIKQVVMASDFQPLPSRQAPAGIGVRLGVLLTGNYPQDGQEVPEIHAFIRRRGERNFVRVAGRSAANQAYIGDRGAIWTGQAHHISQGRQNPVYEPQQYMFCDFAPWRDSANPIEEVTLAIYDGPRPGGVVYQPYSGSRSVSIRGIWLGAQGNIGTPYGMQDNSGSAPSLAYIHNYLTIGMDLARTVTLDRNRREVTYRINHTMPGQR